MELAAYLREFGLDPSGTIEDLRRRFVRFIKAGYYSQGDTIRVLELETRHQNSGESASRATSASNTGESCQTDDTVVNRRPHTPPPQRNSNGVPPSPQEWQHDENDMSRTYGEQPSIMDAGLLPGFAWRDRRPSHKKHVDDRTFDRLKAWDLRFNGRTDPIAFIDRLEELACSQRVPLDPIPLALSGCFEGKAYAWWQNKHEGWTGWESFKMAFLRMHVQTNFLEDLEDEIRDRRQRPGEIFEDYALDLETKMRYAGDSEAQKLSRTYKNMLDAAKMFIDKYACSTLDELADRVRHLEISHGGPLSLQATDTLSARRWESRLPPRQEEHGAQAHVQANHSTIFFKRRENRI